jgi:prolyl-tRNA synthetase (EC 6.1.1.15)
MGALIMAHSDDNGLVLPPHLAPIPVVIVPIYKNKEELDRVSIVAKELVQKLRKLGIEAKYDDNDKKKPGWKFAEYELKGVPIRLAIGPRDLENNSAEVARRDTLTKQVVSLDGIETFITELLEDIQQNIFNKALKFREETTTKVETYEEFKKVARRKRRFRVGPLGWDHRDRGANKS